MRKGARKYDKVIEVWSAESVPDGFGGNTTQETLIAPSYCSIKTLEAKTAVDLGLNDNEVVIEVRLRHRGNLPYDKNTTFFKYKGVSYNINRIQPIGLDGLELKIIATSNTLQDSYTPPVEPEV